LTLDGGGSKLVSIGGISNLWKFNMSRGARLVYTLLSESGLWVVVVLEMFLTHKEYEKRFGYC